MAAEFQQYSQSAADEGGEGDGGCWRRGFSRVLSAKILLCRVSQVFPPLAVALVVWLVARMTFGAEGVLLPVVAALIVGARHPGLEMQHNHRF